MDSSVRLALPGPHPCIYPTASGAVLRARSRDREHAGETDEHLAGGVVHRRGGPRAPGVHGDREGRARQEKLQHPGDLVPRPDPELAEDAIDVVVDRAIADHEALRDVPVAQTSRHQPGDLQLAGRESRSGHE